MQLRHLLATAATAILVVVPCTTTTHAATDTPIASQSSATAAPPIPYPPSGTYDVGRKARGSVVPAAGIPPTVSCSWEVWPVGVIGNTARERVDQTCTGIVEYQSVVLTVVHCDQFLWGCFWNTHPEYGEPSGYRSGPGTVTVNGTWNLPASGNGYFIQASFYACDEYDDCGTDNGGSPEFFVS